jgi:cbb3-type cytochrome oxidase subunit 3
MDVTHLSFAEPKVLAFVHFFLLGFVMMVIFGAMAQLVPVVLEVGHFGVELFYAIWPLLLIGSLLMVFGFLFSPALLPYGGVVVLIAMMIFVVEIFLTMFKVQKLTLVMSSVLISNTFLFFGIIFGLLMALSYAGTLSLDIASLLQAHVYSVIAGYIIITIMGLSIVLVPMFTLSHSFSLKPLEIGMGLMSIAVVFVIIASLFFIEWLRGIAYAFAVIAMLSYFYLIYIIYKTRPRKENDIYALSLMFSYLSMLFALVLGVVYLFVDKENFLLASMWLFFFGFFAFLITGHIYKIIPFLVWFEKFSPLVGKQKVPMLADMVPKKSSQAQLLFCAVGVIVITCAILFRSNECLGAGASFLLVGTLAFVRNVFYMINFK